MPAGSQDCSASGPPTPEGAGVLYATPLPSHNGILLNSCRKGGGELPACRCPRIAWFCISAKELKAWVFCIFFSHLGFTVFFPFPIFPRGWGEGDHTARTPYFSLHRFCLGRYSFPPVASGASGSFKRCAIRSGWRRRLSVFPLPAAGVPETLVFGRQHDMRVSVPL